MTVAARSANETILIVEDDPAIRMGLEMNLRHEGYRVLSGEDVSTGLKLARDPGVDLILLDLMLPDGSGLDMLRSLRQEEREIPILILTARGLERDKVKGLDLGADDYITKPFGLAELLSRIGAALRRERQRRQQQSREVLGFDEVTIDPAKREIHRRGKPVKLTVREFDLALHLVEHPDRVFSRDQLLIAIWGMDYEGTTRTVDNFISSIRAKLERDPAHPAHFITVHGVGYRFQR